MEDFTPPNNTKGADVVEQSVCLNANYTLVSQTALQKMFNATTNGALILRAGTTYYFECDFDLSAMSVTSGGFGFGFLGTATFNSLKYTSFATKSTIGTPTAPQITTVTVATSTNIVTATITATGHAKITGIIRVNAGGTLIPSVSLGIASAAIVGINSKFQIWQVGNNVMTNTGNWN